jgi:hypothetical protein
MARSSAGAPGIDGVTFEAIEESGAESFLGQIRDELITNTYRPQAIVEERQEDGEGVRFFRAAVGYGPRRSGKCRARSGADRFPPSHGLPSKTSCRISTGKRFSSSYFPPAHPKRPFLKLPNCVSAPMTAEASRVIFRRPDPDSALASRPGRGSGWQPQSRQSWMA